MLMQHQATSIYLQMNGTLIPKEASNKKFHTFVTHRTKWLQGRRGVGGVVTHGVYRGCVGEGRGGGAVKQLTDELVINL